MTRPSHPPPRLRCAAAVAVLVGLGLVGALSLPLAGAQVRPKPRPPAGAPPAAAKPPRPGPSAATSVAAAPQPSASAVPAVGPVAAPRADSPDGGARSSPLNPNPDELPAYVAPGATAAPPPVPTVDYDKLLGDIAALRARVADVSDALFVSRIALALETNGDHARIGHLTVELDDGVVYTAPANFSASDPAPIYEHAVAAGHHAVTVEVDRKDDRDDTFRDAQRTRFIVDVPKDQRLSVTLRISDDSTMAKTFADDRRGKYDLRVRMQAAAAPVKR